MAAANMATKNPPRIRLPSATVQMATRIPPRRREVIEILCGALVRLLLRRSGHACTGDNDPDVRNRTTEYAKYQIVLQGVGG